MCVMRPGSEFIRTRGWQVTAAEAWRHHLSAVLNPPRKSAHSRRYWQGTDSPPWFSPEHLPQNPPCNLRSLSSISTLLLTNGVNTEEVKGLTHSKSNNQKWRSPDVGSHQSPLAFLTPVELEVWTLLGGHRCHHTQENHFKFCFNICRLQHKYKIRVWRS